MDYIRKSLLTIDEHKARVEAHDLYNELKFRLERGLSLYVMTFSQTAEGYFEHLQSLVDQGRIKSAKLQTQKWQAKYMLEYFADLPLEQITDAKVITYQQWRNTYWTSGPGVNQTHYTYVRAGKVVRAKVTNRSAPSVATVNKEATVLRAIFEWARKSGWITTEQIPAIPSERGKKNRRPAFEPAEVKKLMDTAYARYADEGADHLKFNRALLYGFICVLAHTGMRPFEAIKLKWQDIDFASMRAGKDFFKIDAKGKNKERTLVTSGHWLHVLQTIETAHLKYRADLSPAEIERSRFAFHYGEDRMELETAEASDELNRYTRYPNTLPGYVFCHPDGAQIKSFKGGFKSLLKAAELTHNKHGQEYYDYSLRHFYATEQLAIGKGIYLIAKNMGTSVQMIEDYYGHVTPEKAAMEIIRETENQAYTKSDAEHLNDKILAEIGLKRL